MPLRKSVLLVQTNSQDHQDEHTIYYHSIDTEVPYLASQVTPHFTEYIKSIELLQQIALLEINIFSAIATAPKRCSTKCGHVRRCRSSI